MPELAAYYARKRLRGALVLSAGIVLLVALYIWIFPSIEASGVDLEQYVNAFPPALRAMFGIRALGTIEGFLAAELYAFVWLLLLGLYFAYAAAGLVAGDVETERMDVLLSLPIRRTSIVTEKFASLFVPIALVNVVTPVSIAIGVAFLDQSIPLTRLAMVHLLSIPYLLVCAGIGLVASVAFDRADLAQRAAMGVVFGLFLVESVVTGTDYEWLGAISPTRYYDQTAILVDGTYDYAGAAILLVVVAVLVAASALYFKRKDVQ